VSRRKTEVHRLVEFVDIYPTVAGLAGLALPEGLEGLSFESLLDEPTRPWKTGVFTQVLRQRPEGNVLATSLRTATHRLTRWTDENDPGSLLWLELYDREVDPEESHNVADLPAYASVRSHLLAQLEAGWLAAVPFP
jgi:iduronate 2-sulfatase